MVRPSAFIDKAIYSCDFGLRGVGESLGARASRPRRWKINSPLERARRPLSQVAAYALPRRLLRSKISFGAQGLLNMVPIGQTPQPNRSIDQTQ